MKLAKLSLLAAAVALPVSAQAQGGAAPPLSDSQKAAGTMPASSVARHPPSAKREGCTKVATRTFTCETFP